VPEKISVIGSDGIEQGDWVSPPLTSIQLPFTEISESVANWLNPRLENHVSGQNSIEILFKSSLLLRNSTSSKSKNI